MQLRVNHHLPHFRLVKLRNKPPLQTESTLYVFKAFISTILKKIRTHIMNFGIDTQKYGF